MHRPGGAAMRRVGEQPSRTTSFFRNIPRYEHVSTFDVFLSHNSKDKPAVRELKQLLAARGCPSGWTKTSFVRACPGNSYSNRASTSNSVAVLVGRDGVGPWEDEEMQAALRLAVSTSARDSRSSARRTRGTGTAFVPEQPHLGGPPHGPDRGRRGEAPLGHHRQSRAIRPGRASCPGQPAITSRPGESPDKARSQPAAGPSKALAMWREKLAFLQEQEALLADPAQRFAVRKQIEEAQAKIQNSAVNVRPRR